MRARKTDIFGRDLKQFDNSALVQKFTVPPFNVLDTKSDRWQELKRMFVKDLGLRSELGRGVLTDSENPANAFNTGGPDTLRRSFERASPGGQARPAMDYSKRQRGDGSGKPFHAIPGGHLSNASVYLQANGKPIGGAESINAAEEREKEWWEEDDVRSQSGTSIFDPVLCYLFYRWYTPRDSYIIDPFAGGSVRGMLAAILGRYYTGMELRPEQIASNEEQAQARCVDEYMPIWAKGDSRDIVKTLGSDKYGGMLSCPPYFDLEKYSDDPRDLSNTTWETFLHDYNHIIKESVSLLADNSFACFVVGDFRDKDGNIRDFTAITSRMFEEAGCKLYNKAVLSTAIGSLPLRAKRAFVGNRKLGPTYQTVLISCKGDWREAVKKLETEEQLESDKHIFIKWDDDEDV
jgi:hypothetical protein